MLSETRLVFLDVETTGLSPAMGDRVVELGMIICQGPTEINRSSHLINPGRPIPWDAQRIHGISDQDVSECPPFKKVAEEVESTLVDAWITVLLDEGPEIEDVANQAGYRFFASVRTSRSMSRGRFWLWQQREKQCFFETECHS